MTHSILLQHVNENIASLESKQFGSIDEGILDVVQQMSSKITQNDVITQFDKYKSKVSPKLRAMFKRRNRNELLKYISKYTNDDAIVDLLTAVTLAGVLFTFASIIVAFVTGDLVHLSLFGLDPLKIFGIEIWGPPS